MKTNKLNKAINKLDRIIMEGLNSGYGYTISHNIIHELNILSNQYGVFRIKNTLPINQLYKKKLSNGELTSIFQCQKMIDKETNGNNMIKVFATNLHNNIKGNSSISFDECYNYTLCLFTIKALRGINGELKAKRYLIDEYKRLYPHDVVRVEDSSFNDDISKKVDLEVYINNKLICKYCVKPESYTKKEYFTKHIIKGTDDQPQVEALKYLLIKNNHQVLTKIIVYDKTQNNFKIYP